jgi:hypothetical protein
MTQYLRYFLLLTIAFTAFTTTVNAQFVNFEETWQKFLKEDKTSNISELPQPSKEDKQDYVKWCLIYATTNYCGGDLKQSKKLVSEIEAVGEPVYKTIPGFVDRFKTMKANISAYKRTEYAWVNFISYDRITFSDLEKLSDAKAVCEKGTLAKYSYMMAWANYCDGNVKEAKNLFENRVMRLVERTSLKVESVERLDEKIAQMKQLFKDLDNVNTAWKKYLTTGESEGFKTKLSVMECNPVPNIKAYIMEGTADICQNGEEMLDKINALRENYEETLPADVSAKLAEFEASVGEYSGDITVLDKAWAQFMKADTTTTLFMAEYCDKEAQIKAYIMEGTMFTCAQGKAMMAKIEKIQKEFKPELGTDTAEKLEGLATRIQGLADETAELESIWQEFLENGDSLVSEVNLKRDYCDKTAQAKSWIIKAHGEACKKGKAFKNAIGKLKELEKLTFDEDMKCSLERLDQKIWDCEYWKLVLQAREETNEEREIFGPAAAQIMEMELNSEEQPCETKVAYTPIGNIGVKYVISTFLCQNIDLAKMGDPEYYKKIATFVDEQVLQRYCEADLRCKEDFFIYLEGHTDGNPFNGVSYKQSLDIPEGTKFTHYVDDEIEEKVTEREMTKSLRSNMELGIARAWTVKNQLDFMGVPITIGAYEHPRSEKGGEYRRVEIELNITNLLLDFYEKRLAELVEESGIGKRPDAC